MKRDWGKSGRRSVASLSIAAMLLLAPSTCLAPGSYGHQGEIRLGDFLVRVGLYEIINEHQTDLNARFNQDVQSY